MMADLAAPVRTVAAQRIRRRFEVCGLVQGVGFRPFVYAAAARLGLTGLVANTASGVTVEVEGDPAAVEAFGRDLLESQPPLAQVTAVTTSALEPRGGTRVLIEDCNVGGPLRTLASPDVAMCADCRRELLDPADRRHKHPFISCTNC